MLLRAVVGWFGILVVAIVNEGLRDRFIPRFRFFAAELSGTFFALSITCGELTVFVQQLRLVQR